MKNVAQTIKVLISCKDEIKTIQCKSEEDSLKQLITACLSIVLKFFELLKKQLKKSEVQINFEPREIGHLVPLSIGHKNKPTESETQYIRTVL